MIRHQTTAHVVKSVKRNAGGTFRHVHYLKRNDRSETIHQCVWYDCETRPVTDAAGVTKHILVFGWAAYRRRTQRGTWTETQWFRFTEGTQLWEWINSKTRPKTTLYVWAHNSYFDYTVSLGSSSLLDLGWTLKQAIIDSPPFVMTYAKLSSKLVLVDTLNIWRMSLAAMGSLVGLPKLSMPSSWTGKTSDDEYCRRDVEIIMKAVCGWADFLRDKDMGKFCLTVASQAMQTFRHRYLKDDILIDSDDTALRISRAAYHGGRVECFRIGKLHGPLYLLDINSLYPYVMATNHFPLRLVTVAINPTPVELLDVLHGYLVCCHAWVETNTPVIPKVVKGKLIFPVGRFDAYITSPELVYLLEHEKVHRVTACAIYEPGMPFPGFCQELYNARVECGRAGKLVEAGHYKLLLNSFSGKWGQNGIKWTTVGRSDDLTTAFWPVVDFSTDEITNFRRWQGLIQRRDTFPESRSSHPAIAAHITAYGRMVLWTLMRQITPEHYFYCDTDSLLVDKEGLKIVEERVSQEVLGSLKLVGTFAHAVINGCKDYVLDGIRTCKGIRDKAIQLDANRYRQEQWVGFRTALRKGWLDAPRVRTITKTLRRHYDKGVVTPDGRVFPHQYGLGGSMGVGCGASPGSV